MLHIESKPFSSSRNLRRHYGYLGPTIVALVVYVLIAAGIIAIPESTWKPDVVHLSSALAAYALLCVMITCAFIRVDLRAEKRDALNFHRNIPFEAIGKELDSLVYTFRCSNGDIFEQIASQFIASIQNEYPYFNRKMITITDNDRRLRHPERRQFLCIQLPESSRGTQISLLVGGTKLDSLHFFEYRLLVRGPIKTGNVVGFVAFSPFTLPFWLWGRVRRGFRVAYGLMELYPATFETNDLVAAGLAMQKIVMDDMIQVLEANGVDTSDLKTRRSQILNINVFGGQASIGSVIQGSQTQTQTVQRMPT